MFHSRIALIAAVAAISTPAVADSPRELLVSAAFATSDKPTALAKIGAAIRGSDAILSRSPGDREAALQHAIAIGYRGQLQRNLADVKASRAAFETLAASNPRDAEAQMALAGWNLGTIIELGQFMGRAVLGARKDAGFQALNRAVALGGGRAFFPAYASFLRIRIDPRDVAGARKLAEAALKDGTPTPIDRITQKYAAAILAPLRAGNGKAAAALAKKLMAFGRLG